MGDWSTADIADQTGRTVVVTGASSGIGFHAARELAQSGARVVLAVRDQARGEEARRRIPAAGVEVRPLDLADLDSVRAFAAGWEGPLDLLVNNAGIMAPPLQRTAQGFESQLGTNHLGHFALTGLLLEPLLAGTRPRVTTVSSQGHRMGRMRWDDLQWERGYQKWLAYGQAKLANLLFAFELQRRADGAHARLTSTAAHPGYSATALNRSMSRLERAGSAVLNRLVAQSAEAGALPTLYAATMELPGGAYAGPDGPGEVRGRPQLVSASKAATDAQAAARLWALSEELTGVRYDFGVPAAS